jgi:hypothetical protein
MQKHQAAISSYHFRRANGTNSIIEILNEGSYVMAEYSERTGAVKWQRVVLASQKEILERCIRERYPVQTAAAAASRS